jgi:hypothetical protein
MDRPYTTGNSSDTVTFFIGTEVEKTPAFGLKTLFVVGTPPTKEIITLLDDPYLSIGALVKHIYFGANMSFPKIDPDDIDWNQWETMIIPFLKKGYLCTLDVDITCVEGLAESSLVEYPNFIPMISAKIPYLRLLGYNTVLKIDDKSFNRSNPGVWCHSLHDLTNRSNFTGWDKYTQDEVIK